jgi:hypothetical protein
MSISKNNLTIFINTSDTFEDCWDPFFKLFKMYWPHCNYSIILNTEIKDYSYEDLKIKCAKVAKGESKRLTWSECLMRALDKIDSKYILYLQEDYFLESPVKSDTLISLINEMEAKAICSIVLSGGVGPWNSMDSSLICEVDKSAKWRLSLQAGLWKKTTLRALLRKHENPWQLESYGTRRTRNVKEKFCCVNRDNYIGEGKEVFPYKPTGIVAGRWVREIVEPLFQKNNIKVNFSIRGFHNKLEKKRNRKNLIFRLIDRIRSYN